MSEISLSDLYSNMQAEMLQTLHTGSVPFAHSGTKGDNTEANWIAWFKKYLPARYAVDKAIVIDSGGKCSQQIDLVIYDAQYSYVTTARLSQISLKKSRPAVLRKVSGAKAQNLIGA